MLICAVAALPCGRTWWFAVLSATLLVALVAIAYRYRAQKFLEMQRTRLQICEDLHDDVGNTGA